VLNILSIEDVKAAADTRPKLTRAQKVEVVRRLAAFEQPSAIAKSMKEDFGIEITPQAIAFYDPTRYAGKACPKCWADLFWTMRAEIIAGKADVGAAYRAVRVRWLDQMARAQMDKGNTAEARALLKQAADEMSRIGGQREDGRDESDSELSKLSDAELHARCAALAKRLGFEGPAGRASGDRDRAADEPQPAGQPLSG
jgi:hypothetical protein